MLGAPAILLGAPSKHPIDFALQTGLLLFATLAFSSKEGNEKIMIAMFPCLRKWNQSVA